MTETITWDAVKARQQRLMAQRILLQHDHNPSDRDPLTRENCGACVLQGYRPRGSELKRADGPNYAGWARIYVQAGASVPEYWRDAFQNERDGAPYSDGSVNQPYADALERDIATYGLRFRA